MNCKNCGGVNEPGAKVCIFCGTELQEKEKVYIPVHEYNSPPPAAGFNKSRQELEGGKAFALAIVSFLLGFIVIRAILAGIALSKCSTLIREARRDNAEVTSTVKAARIISILSLVFAGVCLLYMLAMIIARISSGYASLSDYYY